MTLIVLVIYAILVFFLLKDCKDRFGMGVFLIMLGVLVFLSIFSLFAYDIINLGEGSRAQF